MRQMNSASMLLVAALVLSTGCDGLLDTDQPNIVEPDDVESEAGALARRVGAISDFAFAQDGDGTMFEDGHILLSGLMSDEFMLSTTPPTEQEIDQRRVFENNSTLYDMFHNLHRARAAAEGAAVALRELRVEPDADNFIGEMLSLAGFTYIYFGESFCSGVPFSHLEGDQVVYGAPQTTDEMFQTAVARFDAALAEPGVLLELDPESGLEPEITYLAAVGKGRALLDRGLFTEAAAAVVDVPTEFQYVTEHADSPLRLQNAIYSYSIGWLWSVSDLEGDVGLPYRTAEDPRVPFFDEESAGLDNTTPQFTLLKYPDASASVVVADGIEARLIEAEALLQASNLGGMTAILNVLRATQGLDPLGTPGTQDEGVDQLFSERAFWMFATGHRLGDMRRLIRQYGRSAEEVFPGGVYLKGGNYGTDVNLPMPQEEGNNPNFAGCIDRNA
jgi:starch-binding outer membrane protein, SusD/RagB family